MNCWAIIGKKLKNFSCKRHEATSLGFFGGFWGLLGFLGPVPGLGKFFEKKLKKNENNDFFGQKIEIFF